MRSRSKPATGLSAPGWRWVAGVLAAAMLLSIGYRWAFPETAKAAAERLLNCLDAGDGDCFLPYVHPTDAKRNEVDGMSLSRLIAATFAPARRAATRIGPIRFDAHRDANYVRAFREVAFANGRTTTITLTVQGTEDGLTCSPVVWQVLSKGLACRVAQRDYPEGTLLGEKLAAELNALLPVLESAGFGGCIRDSATAPYFSWSQLRERWLRQAATRRMEQQALAVGR